MRPNLNITNQSQNEFMESENNSFFQSQLQQQKAEEMQKMFLMFQKMATDPNMFAKMMSSVRAPEPVVDQRKRQYQIQQHKYRNHEHSPNRKNLQSPVYTKQNRKKASDVLGRQFIQENDSVVEKTFASNSSKEFNESVANSKVILTNKQQNQPKIEQVPIQTSYTLKRNELLKKNQKKQQQDNSLQKYINDDDRPIKPAKGYNYQMDSNQSMVNTSNVQPVDPEKYFQAENRPIKGIQGDFKSYIMKQQGFPMSEQNQANQQQQEHSYSEVPKARTFLKRGSRQHLSSAIDRSASKTKIKTNNNANKNNNAKDGKDRDRDRDEGLNSSYVKDSAQGGERSISQNRVLGRKSVSSKSISKRNPPKDKNQEDAKKLKYSNTTSNYESINTDSKNTRNSQKPPKSKREVSPTFPQPQAQASKKKPKMNIFQDGSSDQQPSQTSNISTTKSQIIPGVFLTKKQLHQILTKYNKAVPQQNVQPQLQELKSKYIDLCNILTQQKKSFTQELQKQKQQFEQYKQSQMLKIKNQRKVQERNVISSLKGKQKQKQKEEFEALKKVLEKQREEFRHKEKNYKIMIQKYKKMAEDRDSKGGFNSRKQQIVQTSKYEQKQVQQVKKKLKKPTQQPTNNSPSQTKPQQQYSRTTLSKKQNQNKTNSSSFPSSSIASQKQKLPSYQDLKKSSLHSSSHSPALESEKQKQHKQQKYQYLEEFNNVATVKDNGFKAAKQDQEEDIEDSEQSDREEIVEYNRSMKLSDLMKIPLSIKMVTDQMIDNLFRCQNSPDYKKYLQLNKRPRTKIHSSRNTADKKVTNVYADGGKQVIFDTGVRKQYFNNGYTIIFFANGDIKQKLADETVLYFYKEKEVDQITLPNQTNIYRFENNQVQFHFADKSVEIRHPDGTFKIL